MEEEIKIKIFDAFKLQLDPYFDKGEELNKQYNEACKPVSECNKKGLYCGNCDNMYGCPMYILREKAKRNADTYVSKIASITELYFINKIKRLNQI